MTAFPRTEGDVSLCFGCQPRGACHLGIHTMRLDGERLTAGVVCPPEHASAPGFAHGGWIASVLDDVLGELPLRLDAPSVTATLTVDYRAPVPVGLPLTATVWVEERSGRRWNVAGELVPTDGGAALATGRGVFVRVG